MIMSEFDKFEKIAEALMADIPESEGNMFFASTPIERQPSPVIRFLGGAVAVLTIAFSFLVLFALALMLTKLVYLGIEWGLDYQ